MVGLNFKKLDLHIHTPASDDFQNGDQVSAENIVEEALSKGLDGIAITDHNTGEWIDRVQDAAKNTDLAIFPGVEITCMGGKRNIHLIALFDVNKNTSHVMGVLSALGLPPSKQGDPNALVEKDVLSVIDIVTSKEWEGIAILAHANSSSGVLRDMRGQQRIKIIQHRKLSAVEATDFQDVTAKRNEKRVVDLLDGNDPDYQRKLAVYQASDNRCSEKEGHCLEGIGLRCSHFKMEKVDLEGLYQCFMDPDVRIRQDFEYQTLKCSMIKKIEVVGGFLDGEVVEFHDSLNSILGAKGSGKSLLIELLRFGLGQPPDHPDIFEDHRSKLEKRLGDYGYVNITFLDRSGTEYIIKRTLDPVNDSPYSVEYDPAQVMPILFLSQNEIIRIAEKEEEQLKFIDRFFNFQQYKSEINRIQKDLTPLDKRMADGLRSMREIPPLKRKIKTIEEEISRIDTELKNDVFKKYNLALQKDNHLSNQADHTSVLKSQLNNLRSRIDDFDLPKVINDLANDPALKRNEQKLKQLRTSIDSQIEDLLSQVSNVQERIKQEKHNWKPTFEATNSEYKQYIQEVGGDHKALASKRESLLRELNRLENDLGRHEKKKARIREIANQRGTLLDELEDLYGNYTQERRQKSLNFQNSSNGKLKLRIVDSSNTAEFRNRLLELKQGSYLREEEIEAICSNISPRNFIIALLRYLYARDQSSSKPESHLSEIAKESGIQLDRMIKLSDFLTQGIEAEKLLELQYKAKPKDRPEISFNIGNNEFRPLKEVSVGQKSTALLIMALSDGDMPIVIDQPEDSLDIRSIWEDICKKLRLGKTQRQFIFTTHNSSVAVASDTDYFIILDASASKAEIVFSGSMDHAPLSDEVLKYLEGGVETYDRKYKKYRMEKRLK